MSFSRQLKRNKAKVEAAEFRKSHVGEKWNEKTQRWEKHIPIRKYQDRKIERHVKEA